MDFLHERQFSLEELMPLIREQLKAGQSVRFSPRGTSMLPMLRQGRDSVVLSPLPERLKKYDIPLYQRKNGQYVLHRIVKTGEVYTCDGDNQTLLESGISREQMIGIVTAFYRGEKRCEVTSLPYRMYCRLWHWSRPVRWLWRGVKGRIRRYLRK